MSLDSLPQYLAAVDKIGELVRIREPVRTQLEIAEIADRAMKAPAVGRRCSSSIPCFRMARKSPTPVAINLFGSYRRMCLALGVEQLDEVGARLSEMLNLKVPEGILGKLAMLPRLAELAKFPPKTRGGKPPCQEVVQQGDEIDLDGFRSSDVAGGRRPLYHAAHGHHPRPGAGPATSGCTGCRCWGRELAMHWQRHKVGAAHWREMAARGERMPVVIALGVIPPASIRPARRFHRASTSSSSPASCAASPWSSRPPLTCDLDVPAEAEIVIEGYIDPAEHLVMEGPFGDHTGFYSLADYYPKVHVTALTSKKTPVYLATLVGRPPMEDYYLGHATERIFLRCSSSPCLRSWTTTCRRAGIFHNLVFVSIDKQYPGQAWKVMNAIWGQGLMSLAKVLVVVDREVNVQDPDEAWWVALNHIDPERDVRFTMGPVDVLDHASRAFTYGSKMGIDATRKWKEEGFEREWPERIEMDEETKQRVDAMWSRLGITTAR